MDEQELMNDIALGLYHYFLNILQIVDCYCSDDFLNRNLTRSMA